MEACAQDYILDCGDGVRLRGALSEPDNPRGLIILLHGWEGSQDSTYVISHGRRMFDTGLSVFRLNYRDHGDTHSLNKDIFHSARFDEVYGAIKVVCAMRADMPIYITGFSLGGNFALRLARALVIEPIANIARITAISPVIDPLRAAPIVDINPLIRRYFLKKWTGSLVKKQAAFPDVYDFGDLKGFKTVTALSTHFIPQYTDYKTTDEYFNAYRIAADDIADCTVPIDIVMAADDPVLPAGDVLSLKLNANTRLHYLDHGGHNGFFESLRGPTWYDRLAQQSLGEGT